MKVDGTVQKIIKILEDETGSEIRSAEDVRDFAELWRISGVALHFFDAILQLIEEELENEK